MKINTTLQQDVLGQLDFESGIHAENISVSVSSGIVTLTGSVPAYEEKLAAAKAVEHMSGVLAIVNELVVCLPEGQLRSDKELAEAALSAVYLLTTISLESVKITAQDGCLTLIGTVGTWSQRETVDAVVRHLSGVVDIANLVEVKPLELQPDVCGATQAAFERLALPRLCGPAMCGLAATAAKH